ncbi:MAG: DUF481 domain-containing protein [Longimicrobiales bacterium]
MVRILSWVSVPVLLLAAPLAGQDVEDPETVGIFFDCQTMGCRDLDYFRREIPFVNWVRDREVADVHVLVTSQQTGGGGSSYTLAFLGLGSFEDQDQDLTASVGGDATEDDRRSAVARQLRLGLVRYVAATPTGARLTVTVPGSGTEGAGEEAADAVRNDPWDFWVFRIGANGFVNGEATSRFSNYSLSLSADRTTETWKVDLSGRRSENRQRFELSDGDVVEAVRTDWSASGSLVRSIGDRWAAGVRADARSSTLLNQDLQVALRPGLEYNFFPYAESSRRSLTLQYLVGPVHFDYISETLFGRTEETRWEESLTAGLSLVQPWGRWSTSVSGSHYFHDIEKYSVDVSGSLNVRLFRGFSVRVAGNYSWIRDQLFIAAAGATDEEILLRQRQLETSYRYFTSFGIEYRFGSIFNNVVNPRFGGGGGEFFIF